jgi:aminoglycoside/choline kinase family phosphotransferase
MENSIEKLSDLFEIHFKEKVTEVKAIPPSGSSRRYYRLSSKNHSSIGTFGDNKTENEAFFSYTNHFNKLKLNVPKLFIISDDRLHYLQEDVGDTSLYHLLPNEGESFGKDLTTLYKKSIKKLAFLQIKGGENFDYSAAYPRDTFDKLSMVWDCNYFKYYFLKPANIPFSEEALEEDFEKLASYLSKEKSDFFLFRDFQSRNIIIEKNEPYFIDYQGGRRGALQYDLASLLFQAKANIPHHVREELLDYYISVAEKLTTINPLQFKKYYYVFVLIRHIQVLGAYGLRGLIERKEHFLKSIPFALKNIEWIFANRNPEVDLPELKRVLLLLAQSEQFKAYDKSESEKKNLVVTVQSFSYKKGGIPPDPSGNGGGFAFDCRFLHNPGRYQPYKKQTGLDKPVIDFLKTKSTIDTFLQSCYKITDEAVENYLDRNFDSLMISYGCTGGQHRSVYSAEATAKRLREKYGVKVVLRHRERLTWPK